MLFSSTAFADTSIITNSRVITLTPAIQTSAYATGDLIGGKQLLANASRGFTGSGVISHIAVTDKDAINAEFDLVFFSSDPSASTFTENGSLSINDNDLIKRICTINISSSSYTSYPTNSSSDSLNNNCVFKTLGSTNAYLAVIIRSSATYLSTSSLTFRIGILQD